MSVARWLGKWRSRAFLDRAASDSTILLAGMGRSGTTWAADLINYDHSYRVMFEPFNRQRVKKALPFLNIQYMNPHAQDADKSASARAILSGRLRHAAVDLDNRGLVFRRRLIKEVRCNLMLGWLKSLQPEMSVVLLVRHPLSVARSLIRLGWEDPGPDGDFQVMLRQPELLRDFPVIERALRGIDGEDRLQRLVFQWCVFHLVPLAHFSEGGLTVLFYEELLVDPQQALGPLFASLDRSFERDRLAQSLPIPSRTNYLNPGHDPRATDRLKGWQREFTAAQIQRTYEILALFGMDQVYPAERPTGFPPPDMGPPDRAVAR